MQRQGIIDPVLRGALKLRSCAAQCDIELMPKKQILGFEPASRLEVFAKKSKRLTDSTHRQKDATILLEKVNSRPDGLFREDRAKLRALVEGAARASTALKLE